MDRYDLYRHVDQHIEKMCKECNASKSEVIAAWIEQIVTYEETNKTNEHNERK
ncbi:hypothetical protein [Bacillus cereus]|uniref:hypothetical protein n=1 Tax=Bacillus cereus TaxID=1396 RepID=UPI00363ADE40